MISRFKGTILGKEYIFRSEESETQMLASLKLINEQANQIKIKDSSLSNEQIAILLAFNAISDQIKMEELKDK